MRNRNAVPDNQTPCAFSSRLHVSERAIESNGSSPFDSIELSSTKHEWQSVVHRNITLQVSDEEQAEQSAQQRDSTLMLFRARCSAQVASPAFCSAKGIARS